jgi:hypothetical protein
MCKAATPAPWKLQRPEPQPADHVRATGMSTPNKLAKGAKGTVIELDGDRLAISKADAKFLEESRTLVPALIAEVKRQRRWLDSFRFGFGAKATQNADDALKGIEPPEWTV